MKKSLVMNQSSSDLVFCIRHTQNLSSFAVSIDRLALRELCGATLLEHRTEMLGANSLDWERIGQHAGGQCNGQSRGERELHLVLEVILYSKGESQKEMEKKLHTECERKRR
jgi:hypothetical protein